jgi:hypothetical protein
MLIVAGVFASTAQAQDLSAGVDVDLVVDIEQGECGEGECADDERPVTFDARLEIDEQSAQDLNLSTEEIVEVNDALAGVELTDELIDITVEDPDGGTQEVEDEETICLQPGEFDVTAVVAEVDTLETDVVEALNEVDEGSDLTAEDVTIEDFDEPFTVDECDENGDDDDNGNVDIDDRDQENVCNNVVNIINEDVQNPDVDNTQDNDVDVGNSPDDPIGETPTEGPEAEDEVSSNDQAVTVTDEQVVDIAQELNVSPVIVQTCIQQNAGRDANINSNNNDENIDEEIIDEEFDDEEFNDEEVIIDEDEDFDTQDNGEDLIDDDEDLNVQDDGRGQVLADTIPNQVLPNTGGISPAAVLAGLGFTLLLASPSAGYAVARRRS